MNNFKVAKQALMIVFIVFLWAIPQKSHACEIEFEILKGKKEVYKVGDTLVVKVKVELTHRTCPVKLKKTKFKMKGIKVVKATGWKKLTSMKYERKLKIVITGAKKGKAVLNAIRECEKDGGFGSFKLEVKED
jgi:hypothetical protein